MRSCGGQGTRSSGASGAQPPAAARSDSRAARKFFLVVCTTADSRMERIAPSEHLNALIRFISKFVVVFGNAFRGTWW